MEKVSRVNVDKRLELIFSQAAALSQSGRMKSEIHVLPGEVFLLNGDGTVLMRFDTPGVKSRFAFRTDDYDSQNIRILDGELSFVQDTGDWERIKTPAQIPTDKTVQVTESWGELCAESDSPGASFSFDRSHLSLIEERMSHLEISSVTGKMLLLQRDIYSGTIVRIWEGEKAGDLFKPSRADFGPVALRTSDFLALFAFQNSLTIDLYQNWARVRGQSRPPYEAFISGCTFGEMMKGD